MALLMISLDGNFDVCFRHLEEVEVGRKFLEVSVLIDVFSACLSIFQVFRFFFPLMLMYCFLQARSVFNTSQLAWGIGDKIS